MALSCYNWPLIVIKLSVVAKRELSLIYFLYDSWAAVQVTLYMSCLQACRCCGVLKEFFSGASEGFCATYVVCVVPAGLPLEWVRLDPYAETLCAIRLAQPEAMLAAQLERSKDVVAQSIAIAGAPRLIWLPLIHLFHGRCRNCLIWLTLMCTLCHAPRAAVLHLTQTCAPSLLAMRLHARSRVPAMAGGTVPDVGGGARSSSLVISTR